MSFMAVYLAHELHTARQADFEHNARIRRLAAEKRLERRAERLSRRAGRVNRRAEKAALRLAVARAH